MWFLNFYSSTSLFTYLRVFYKPTLVYISWPWPLGFGLSLLLISYLLLLHRTVIIYYEVDGIRGKRR
jgi:hypothetical protein